MSDINDGGPAFPIAASTGDPRDGVYCQTGMTLRDYFAAAETLDDIDETVIFDIAVALAGPIPTGSWKTNTVEWIKWNSRWRAEVRFIRADAMLKAKEAKP
jgi:hypothetical protein